MLSFRSRNPRPNFSAILLIPAILSTILHVLPVCAYIPALPVNDTSRMNLTDASTIALSWSMPAGVFSGPVSFQLQADVATGGTTRGALVHFAESTMGPNVTSETPWIAYVSCDANETGASMEWDVFTLARDRGAVSALLYSPTSQSCLLNQEYITDFEKPLDVFATGALQVARVLDSQFNNTNATFYTYNGTLLNDSFNAVNLSLAGQTLREQSFLIGTLTARNSTGQATQTAIPGPTQSASDSGGGRKQPTAMIALYVVTGCILGMFVLMIFMAARRAILHPERYGRREGDENQAAQSRTQGVAQALLDTFPVIKFNRQGMNRSGNNMTVGSKGPGSDTDTVVDARDATVQYERDQQGMGTIQGHGRTMSGAGMGNRHSIAMRSLHTDETGSPSYHSAMEGQGDAFASGHDDASIKSFDRQARLYPHGNRQRSGTTSSTPSASGSGSGSGAASRRTSRHDLPILGPGLTEMPGEMEEQCPICLIDFEEGDDLRVLPCEREHVYHQTCIDPWLLNVSSSCPLCRKDFNNPSSTESPTSPSHTDHPHPPTASGFAKYLAFMRKERRRSSAEHAGQRRRARTGTGTSDRDRHVEEGLGPQAGPGPFA